MNPHEAIPEWQRCLKQKLGENPAWFLDQNLVECGPNHTGRTFQRHLDSETRVTMLYYQDSGILSSGRNTQTPYIVPLDLQSEVRVNTHLWLYTSGSKPIETFLGRNSKADSVTLRKGCAV